jgi:TolB-like protein/tetratricopeptide (TPR) repeat protein
MEADGDLVEDLAFGRFRLDASGGALWCDGQKLALRSRSLDVLRVLAAADGKLVTKDTLMARVWPDAVVEENALQVHISALRRALRESVGNQYHIVTVAGRGYRFVREPIGIYAGESPPRLQDRPSIAVLPFPNLSGDPAQDYFADGMVEDIITALTRVPSLFVIARTSSSAYRRKATDIRTIGRELGARYVLEGSVRKAGDRLRISGQLILAETGLHLWAENFEGSLSDVFRIQDELTARVVGALLPSLQKAEIERARRKPPDNLDAYDMYLQALARRRTRTRAGNDEALRLLERALRLDPAFAAAAMMAGTTWSLRVSSSWSSVAEAREQSLHYLRLAARLDPNGAEALATLARMLAAFGRDLEEARTLAEQSIALSPNSVHVLRSSGFAFVYLGEPELGLDCLRRGLQLSPRDLWVYDSWSGVAMALILLERDQDAIAAARNAVQQDPQYTMALRTLAAALALAGQFDEAQSVVAKIVELDPDCSLAGMKARFGDAAARASVRYLDGLRRAGLPA